MFESSGSASDSILHTLDSEAYCRTRIANALVGFSRAIGSIRSPDENLYKNFARGPPRLARASIFLVTSAFSIRGGA